MLKKKIHQSRKFSTVENFPPKVKNFLPLQNVPTHVIFGIQLFGISWKWKIFHWSGKISTFLIRDEFGHAWRSRGVKNFSTKSGKFSTSAECPNSCDFGINFFFWDFLEVENFPPKSKNVHFPPSGWVWARFEVQMKKKNSTKVDIFPPKVENFPPLQNVPIHSILETKIGNGLLKWKNFHFLHSGWGWAQL